MELSESPFFFSCSSQIVSQIIRRIYTGLASVFLCGDKIRLSKNKAGAIPSTHQTLKFYLPSPLSLQKNKKMVHKLLLWVTVDSWVLSEDVRLCAAALSGQNVRSGTNWPIKHMYRLLFAEWHSTLRTLAASQDGVKLNTCSMWLQIIKRTDYFFI